MAIDANFEKAMLNKVDAFSRNLDKGIAQTAENIRAGIQDNIISGKKYSGGRLAKNKPSTVNRKGFNWPLVRTGQMAKSITKKSVPDGYEIYVGFNPVIAAYLQYGYSRVYGKKATKGMTKYHSVTVAARPFFGINNPIKQGIRKVIVNFFNNGR